MPQAICVFCGASLLPGAGACSSCGRRVDGGGTPPPLAVTQEVPASPAPGGLPVAAPAAAAGPASAKTPSRPMPVSSIVILGLGVVLILVAVVLVSRKPAPPAGLVLGAARPTSTSMPAQVPALPTAAPATVQAPVAQTVPPGPVPTRQASVQLPPTRAAAPFAPTPTPPIEKVYVCRKGAEFKIDPDKAIVYVDGEKLGKAEDWNGRGDDKTYRFARPGAHYAKFVREGYRTGWVKITVRPDADTKIAEVELKLHRHGEKEED